MLPITGGLWGHVQSKQLSSSLRCGVMVTPFFRVTEHAHIQYSNLARDQVRSVITMHLLAGSIKITLASVASHWPYLPPVTSSSLQTQLSPFFISILTYSPFFTVSLFGLVVGTNRLNFWVRKISFTKGMLRLICCDVWP